MLFLSGLFLLYTALIVPVQIFLWDYSNPCVIFPTLYFDVLVDVFFLVPCAALVPRAAGWGSNQHLGLRK